VITIMNTDEARGISANAQLGAPRRCGRRRRARRLVLLAEPAGVLLGIGLASTPAAAVFMILGVQLYHGTATGYGQRSRS
jgi:hypothetical protein